jgi:hypothetical protein
VVINSSPIHIKYMVALFRVGGPRRSSMMIYHAQINEN